MRSAPLCLHAFRLAAGFLVLLLVATTAFAQTQPKQPAQQAYPAPGFSREAMWPAPTAEDWKLPCLIQWQRTWDDAQIVSRETKKPILICVNMDGEVASEHYAGIRYRRPETASLYAPYVCVIASVYRHNPRDYDEEGRRILCPRFGSVTCGEHIAIEPLLFEQFFDGKRIAPRHIAIELDKREMYDVYYAWDTDTIFNSLRKGIAERTIVPVDIAHEDRPILERVASHDIQDRLAIESAYQHGDRVARQRLLESAAQHHDIDQVELLRLALFGFDVDLARLARQALAQCTSESAVDLIAEALRVPMETKEREALIAALVRLGETFPRARTLAAVHQGLAARSGMIDIDAWSKALGSLAPPAPKEPGTASHQYQLESRLESRAHSYESRPADATARLEFAEACLALAVEPQTEKRYSKLLFEDAKSNALEAEKLGASGWRVNAAFALAAYNLGDRDSAYARAESAVSGMPSDVQSWSSMAVLALFAESRQQAIIKAGREKQPWPPQWLTDVHAAYAVLAHHPLGTDVHIVSHFDFLRWLGAAGQAASVLDEGFARFPDSWLLHDRLRGKILAEQGADALEPAYATRLGDKNASPSLEWFAGYAGLVAAEYQRRSGKTTEALAAYERAIAHYEHAIVTNPPCKPTADHYIALALAGRARIEFESKDLERALDELLASFARKPEAAASLDGLNISPVDTAKMLKARLVEEQRDELAQKLQAALDKLDPELLLLPAYEREVPGASPTNRQPPRQRGSPRDR